MNKITEKYDTFVYDVKIIDSYIKDIDKHKNINNKSKYFHQLCDKAYKYKQIIKIKNLKIKNLKREYTNLNLKNMNVY